MTCFPRLTPPLKYVYIRLQDMANLLEDASTRLAAGMRVDEGEEPECDGKDRVKRGSLITGRKDREDMIPDYSAY